MEKYQYHIFSPYRVCPLGAHVDHQHGLVTGFAIDKGVDLWFNVREDSIVKLSSLSFEGTVEFDLSRRSEVRERHWGDYARGAKYALKKRFELTHGIDGVIKGSLPVGGLSSSAAVLIAYVMAFAKANGITLKPFEVVQIASEAEREYIGLNNGLLDQACIALGQKDGLLFLDCDTNDYRVIRRNPNMPEFEIGIFFSGLTRSLVNSDYNLRVFECMGHLGLTPQSIHKFGTYAVRAKEEEEANKLLQDAIALENAGCFALVLEKIPAALGKKVAETLKIPVIGIGAGQYVDGQVLVMHDMLGLTTEFSPRFLRRYANVHDICLDAFQRYIQDVKSCDFPNEKEQY